MTPNAQLVISALSLCLFTAMIVIWVAIVAVRALRSDFAVMEDRLTVLQDQLRSVGLRRDAHGKLRSSYPTPAKVEV